MKFISGGLVGDFLHQLYAVKNLCEKYKEKADLYINEECGDIFTFGVDKAYNDLYDLVIKQPYIQSFKIGYEKGALNLSSWRGNKNMYNYSWSELMSDEYEFPIPTSENYKWVEIQEKNTELEDVILIHRSNKMINPHYDYYDLIHENIAFLISNTNDFYINGHKKYHVGNFYDMSVLINSCKYFIGNQSSPFALANSMDVPRLGVLDLKHYKFYENEKKYSKNIKTFISVN